MDNITKIAKRKSNIYALLGVKSPEEMNIKANIVGAILLKMQERFLTITEASVILQVDETTLSAIISGQFHDISICELERFREAI